jgi:alpha-glucosidase
MNPNYPQINVEAQANDKKSVLNFYKSLIRLRKSDPLWVHGIYDLILPENNQIYGYTRTYEGRKAVVIANISGKPATYSEPSFKLSSKKLLLSNYEVGSHSEISGLELNPYECRIYAI